MFDVDVEAQKVRNTPTHRRGCSSADVSCRHLGANEVADITIIRRVVTAAYPISVNLIQRIEPKIKLNIAPKAIKTNQISQQVSDMAEARRMIKTGSLCNITLLENKSVSIVITNTDKPSAMLVNPGTRV